MGITANQGRFHFASLPGALLLVAGYCLIHALVRLAISFNLGEDDQIEVVWAQEWRLGYFATHPPLYKWLLASTELMLGPGLAASLLVKYGLVVVTGGFLFLAARRVLGNAAWALLTIESLALIYSLSWRLHEGFTQEAVALAAAAASLHFLLLALQDGRTLHWLGLGCAIGVGVLGSPWYLPVPIALLVAAFMQPAFRARISLPGLCVAAGAAALLAAPQILWFVEDAERFWMMFDLQPNEAQHPHLRRMLRGLFDALRQPPWFLCPLLPLLPFVFPGFVRELGRTFSAGGAAGGDPARLVRDAALATIGVLILAAIVLGIGGQAVIKMAPLFVTTPIWLMALAQRTPNAARGAKRFVALAAAVALFAFVARLANLYLQEPFCNTCRWAIPYGGLAEHLRNNGLGAATIVVMEHELGGNLRARLPDARIVARRWPDVLPPARPSDATTPTALVWETRNRAEVIEHLGRLLPAGVSIEQSKAIQIPWRHPTRPTGYRTSQWHVLTIPPGTIDEAVTRDRVMRDHARKIATRRL